MMATNATFLTFNCVVFFILQHILEQRKMYKFKGIFLALCSTTE